MESSNDAEEPSAIKLMGVGRVFLRNYFLLKDAGMTQAGEELSQLLARIRRFDGEEFESEGEDTTADREDEDPYEEEQLPAVMAEFDLLLGNSFAVPSVRPQGTGRTSPNAGRRRCTPSPDCTDAPTGRIDSTRSAGG